MDISHIHRDQIGKLTSIVTEVVEIVNITPIKHFDIIMECIRDPLPLLLLETMTLNEQQTLALVTAMRERVLKATFCRFVTLDITALCQYNGRGRCRILQFSSTMSKMYGAILRRWKARVGWSVTQDDHAWLKMQRK